MAEMYLFGCALRSGRSSLTDSEIGFFVASGDVLIGEKVAVDFGAAAGAEVVVDGSTCCSVLLKNLVQEGRKVVGRPAG